MDNHKEKILHRVVTFLGRKELDFLDCITKDILFSTGIKIPRSTILKEIIDIFLPLNTRINQIRGYKNLLSMLMEKMKITEGEKNA